MRGKHRLVCVGLCLFVGGCVWETPEPPKEIAAVLADSSFSEVAEVTHQGNLDGLEGCWGHHRVDEGGWTDAFFYCFGDRSFRKVTYTTDSGEYIKDSGIPLSPFNITVSYFYEGTYEKGADGNSVVVTVTDFGLESSHPTGQTASAPPLPGGQYTEDYEICLDGDRMQIWNRSLDPEDYDEGTLWRFDECP